VNYSDFKDEFYKVRENRRTIASLIESIADLQTNAFARLNSGVVDYSADRVQKTCDPDKAMVEAIDKVNRDKSELVNKLNRLREENEPFERIIFEADGTGGEILRLFFIEVLNMKAIAKRLHYDENYIYELRKKALKEAYEKEVKDGVARL